MLTLTNILVVQGPKGQLLVGPRAAFIGANSIDFIDDFTAVYAALRDAVDEPSEMDQLRIACDRWHVDDSRQNWLSNAGLLELVAEACAQRKLGAVLLDDKTLETPVSMRTFEKFKADKKKADTSDGGAEKDKSKFKVPQEFTDRLLEVFDRMMDADAVGRERAEEIKDILKGGLVDRLLALLTSREFLMSKRGVKFVMKLAGRSVFAVLSLAYAAYEHGKDIVKAVEEIVEAVQITNTASSSDDLDKAAKLMASGLSALGVKLLEVIVGEIAPRTRALPGKGGNGGTPKAATGGTKPKTEEQPKFSNTVGDQLKQQQATALDRQRKLQDRPNQLEKSRKQARMQAETFPKGHRPPPESYLSKTEIDTHLKKFEDGASFLVFEGGIKNPDYKSFPKDKFVMPKKDMDALIDKYKKSNGDVSILENALGFKPGSLKGQKLAVVEIDKPKVKFPSGNESGANALWKPGGLTDPGKLPEATLDGFDMKHNNDFGSLLSMPGVRPL